MRLLGHIPDPPAQVAADLRDWHIAGLIGSHVGELPASVDYSGLYEPRDQLAQSCVGWAMSTATLLRSKIMGSSIDRPAPKAIYDMARLLAAPGQPLTDGGSRPSLAIEGMRTYGLVREDRWPETPTNANEQPPLDVFRAGLGALVTGHYRIDGDVPALARSALAKGFPVFFAMRVDAAFMTLDDGTIYDGLKGPALGSHAMCLVSYEPGYFLVANSWGPTWGINGVGRISDAALNAHVFDAMVLTIIPSRVT